MNHSRLVLTILLASLVFSIVLAVGEKPVVPIGEARLIYSPDGPVRANAVRNLYRARSDGDVERARAIEASISRPSTEEIPMGIASSAIIAPAVEGRLRPADFGSDIFVSTGTYIEKNPALAGTSTGDLFCVYEVEGGPACANNYLTVKKSTNNGATWNPLVNIYDATRVFSRPRITIGEGAQNWIIIVYESRNTSGGDARVEVCKLAFDGTGGSALVVDGSSFTSKYSPAVCVDNFSYYNIYISYIRNALFGTDLYIAKSSDFGATWTTQNVDGAGEVESDIAYGDWTLFAVTQTDDANGDIHIVRSTDFGSSWSAPLTISTTHKDYFPRVAAGAESTVVVAYGYAYSATDHDVYYSTSFDNGATFSTGHILSISTLDETIPVVASEGSAIFAAYHRAGETRLADWSEASSRFGASRIVSDAATCEAFGLDVAVLNGTPGSPCPGVVWTNRYTPSDFDIKFDSDCCPGPVAAFSADTLSGDAPLTVHFTDESDGATSLDWDFGDGSAHSSATNPSHTFTEGGDFVVTLTATNSCGSDVATEIVHVTCPEVTASFTMSPSGSGDVPLTVNFIGAGGATSYHWDFGDGSIAATVQRPTHVFDSVGVFTVTLVAANACGNVDTATGLVRVYAVTEPVAGISPTGLDFDSVGIGGYSVRNITISNSGSGMLWVYPEAPTDPAFSFTVPDSFSVAPADEYILNMFFSPTDEATYSATVSFATNDAAHPLLT
ncbi:PKD domain-containing protein, partial [bacterium]|nr:PKD domain-containing protein [bacterium]